MNEIKVTKKDILKNLRLWFDEDGESISVAEMVKGEISNRADKVLKDFVQDQFKEIIDKKLNLILKDFLNKKLNITDGYGDIIKHASPKDIIKEKFDTFMQKKVDKDGRESDYGSSQKRIDWILESKIKKEGTKMIQEIVKELESIVKDHIRDEIKDKFTDTIFDNINLEKILKK